MAVPVAIAGVFLWPGTPAMPNTLFLSEAELDLSRKRLSHQKSDTDRQPNNLLRLCKIFAKPRIYLLTFWSILLWNCGASSFGGYILWLKSLNHYSTPRINQLSSTASGIGIVFTIFIPFASDLFLGPSGAITLALVWNFIALVILAIWNVPDGAKWFAFNSLQISNTVSPVMYGWANDILKNDEQERSFVLVFIILFAQSTAAWIPLFTWQTVDAPRYFIGYTYCAVVSVVLIVLTIFVIRRLAVKQE